MSAIGQPRRRGGLTPDDPMLRRIEEALAGTQVDSFYRRRLRGQVMNRYVAVREGHAAASASTPMMRGGVMGRLGRACLYASVALAGTSAGVLAASQSSLPGDALYGMKLRIDELRLEAAPPELRTALAEYVVESRINEALLLATNGEWERATVAAAHVEHSVEALAGLMGTNDAVEERIERHLAVLSGLIETAPAAARDALAHAVTVSSAVLDPPAGTGAQGAPGGGGSSTGTAGPSTTPPATAAATPAAEPSHGPASSPGAGNGGNGSGGNGNGGNGNGGDDEIDPGTSAAPSTSAPSAKPQPTPSTGPRSSHADGD